MESNQKKKRSNSLAALMAIGTALCGLAVLIFLTGKVATRFQNDNRSLVKRSFQAEAKTTLAALYSGERAFHADFEHYTTDIHSIGFQPSEHAQYKFGFATPSTIVGGALAKQIDSMKYDPERLSSDKINSQYGHRAPASSFADLVKKHCPDCTAGKDGFKIVAISNLDADETLDIWTIDQDKNLKNVSNDVEN